MRLIYIVLSCCLLVCAGCNNTGNNGEAAGSVKTPPQVSRGPMHSKLNPESTGALLSLMSRYYALKNAFVATKAQKVDSAAAQLGMAADSLNTLLQKDSANFTSLKPYMDTIISQNKIITASKDESCEPQRLAFSKLSSAIYGLLKNADIQNAGIYHEYCPMAFNEKGAFWLSDESEIKNPYFGKKMLECGEVTDSL